MIKHSIPVNEQIHLVELYQQIALAETSIKRYIRHIAENILKLDLTKGEVTYNLQTMEIEYNEAAQAPTTKTKKVSK